MIITDICARLCRRAYDWDGAAVTARRLVSLACVCGDDDMFSTDLTLDQLKVGDGAPSLV